MWELFPFCALRRWGKGGNSSLQTKPEISRSIEIHEEIDFFFFFFLMARIVNHSCCHDVYQEENEWGCRKEKELFLQVEEEGRNRGIGEEAWGLH